MEPQEAARFDEAGEAIVRLFRHKDTDPLPMWHAWFLRCQDCGRRFCPKVQGTLYGVRAMVTRTIRCRACFSDPRVSEAELGPLVDNRSIVHHIDGDQLSQNLKV